MNKNDTTSAVVDGVLKALIVGGTFSTAIIVPNVLQILDKPVGSALKKLDKRSQQRELRRVLYYMKKKQLIAVTKSYDYGISITKKGRSRLERVALDVLEISIPKKWDKKWRLVFFDIPEKHKSGRDALTRKLKELGFYQLQRSVLVHPYPCHTEIEAITLAYGIDQYVSYIETDHIDHQALLMKKFRNLRHRK